MAIAAMPPAGPVQTERLTYEEYLDEPEISQPYEIIDGRRFFMPAPKWNHQELVLNMVDALRAFQKASRAGRTMTAPSDILIQRSPLRTRQPDVFFVTSERLAAAGGAPANGPLEIGPDLVIEVLSESETPRSINGKLEDFQRAGVREVWLVSSYSETVQVLRLTESGIETVAAYAYGQTVDSLSVPGLSVAVADIFAD